MKGKSAYPSFPSNTNGTSDTVPDSYQSSAIFSSLLSNNL